jgi:hypothetical protein
MLATLGFADLALKHRHFKEVAINCEHGGDVDENGSDATQATTVLAALILTAKGFNLAIFMMGCSKAALLSFKWNW